MLCFQGLRQEEELACLSVYPFRNKTPTSKIISKSLVLLNKSRWSLHMTFFASLLVFYLEISEGGHSIPFSPLKGSQEWVLLCSELVSRTELWLSWASAPSADCCPDKNIPWRKSSCSLRNYSSSWSRKKVKWNHLHSYSLWHQGKLSTVSRINRNVLPGLFFLGGGIISLTTLNYQRYFCF